jgi:hypothetical protein
LRGRTRLDGDNLAITKPLIVDDQCTKLTTGASAHTDYLNWLLEIPSGIGDPPETLKYRRRRITSSTPPFVRRALCSSSVEEGA